jgi:hypothetical protein
MQAGRLLDIKPCGMKAVPLVLGHSQRAAYHVMRSSKLNFAHLSVLCAHWRLSEGSAPHRGVCCARGRASPRRSRASGDRQRAARDDRDGRPAVRLSVEHERGVAAARPVADLERSCRAGPKTQEPDREHPGAHVGRTRLVGVALRRRSERRRQQPRAYVAAVARHAGAGRIKSSHRRCGHRRSRAQTA